MGIFQNALVSSPFIGHPGEDVVRRAIDDSADPVDPVRPQGLLQGLNDRDASTNGGFDEHVDPSFGGGGSNFFAVTRDHRLVGCDDGFAGGDGLQNQASSWLDPTDQFHHHINGRVVDNVGWIGCQDLFGKLDRPWSVQVSNRDAYEFQISDKGMSLIRTLQDRSHTAANCSQPEQTNSDP